MKTKNSHSKVVIYERDEPIFLQQDEPRDLFILMKGSVMVCYHSTAGKRNIIAIISQAGEPFGEVFIFLNKKRYDNCAVAADRTKVLQIPKEFLYHGCHALLVSNMLSILAQKAYYLNRKLQFMFIPTLRQKISRIFLQNMTQDGDISLTMNREELADFLNVARPSLSRELMKMQEDGLMSIEGKKIKILDLSRINGQ